MGIQNWWRTTMLVVGGLLALGTSAASAAAPPLGHAQSVRAASSAAAHSPARATRRVFPLRTLNPAALRRAKAAAAARYRAPSGAAPARSAPGRNTAVFGGLNQPGLSAADNAPVSTGPPDTTGAIGPSSYIEFVNSLIGIYNRTTLVSPTTATLDAFVGATGNDVFDPQIQYDPVAGHWFYLADDIDASNHAFLVFGWSKTSTPTNTTTDWCRFTQTSDTGGAPAGSFFDDYPKLGHDDSHVTFGSNVFDNTLPNGPFLTARIWAYNKPAVYSTCAAPALTFVGNPLTPLSPLSQGGEAVETPEPANTADASATGYVAASSAPPAFGGTGDEIFTFKVTGSGPTISANGPIGLPAAFDVPANVPQPSSGSELDSLDTRLTQAVAHADPDAGPSPGNEAVWTQHTVDGTSGRSELRWYELLPGLCSGGSCPAGALRQAGTVSDASNFVFNGAISPAMNGNSAAVDYNTGSAENLVDIRARSRTSASPLGSMGGEIKLGTSTRTDDDFTCTPCRWGDYAGASPDPNNTDVVWGSNQLNGPLLADPLDAAWLTRNFAITASGGANPTAALTAAPNPVTTGTPVALSAAGSTDSDGTIANYAFDLNGDGTFETNNGASPTVSTTYGTAGTVNAGVQVTDNDGGKATATVAVTVTGRPVIIARVLTFTETRARFAVGPGRTAITAKKPPRRGTTFKYSLSNPATVRIKIEQKTTGARVNRRCVKRTNARRHKPKCTRFVKKGTLTRKNRPAGASRLKFSGRIGSRKLKPGRYRATITAQAAGGPVSVGRSLSFTILKG